MYAVQYNSHSRYLPGLPYYNMSDSSWFDSHNCGAQSINWHHKLLFGNIFLLLLKNDIETI